MKIVSAAMIAAFLCATPAVAGGTLYDCTVKQQTGPKGWISNRLGLVIDDKSAGKIIDSLTLHFKTGPKPARVRKKGDELIVNWSFSAVTDRSNTNIPSLSYRANLDTKTGAFKIRAKPAAFPQSMRGTGKCAQRKNLSTKQLNRLLKQ